MVRMLMTTLALLLGGCGAEVASTAAVSGTVKAQEARQAQKTMEQVQQKLDNAAQAGAERAAGAEKAMGY